MSAPATALTRRELLNVSKFCFIPVGETISAVVTAAELWPTIVTSGAIVAGVLAYQIPDVETLELSREYEFEQFKIPQDSGGYFEDEESIMKKAEYKGETAKTSSYFKQLELATATVPVIGTAIIPLVSNINFIEGLAVIEFRNKAAVLTERIQFWARLRLDGSTKTDPKTRKIGFMVERRYSSLNTVTILA